MLESHPRQNALKAFDALTLSDGFEKKKKEKEKNNLKLKEALDDELHTGFPPALFFST